MLIVVVILIMLMVVLVMVLIVVPTGVLMIVPTILLANFVMIRVWHTVISQSSERELTEVVSACWRAGKSATCRCLEYSTLTQAT